MLGGSLLKRKLCSIGSEMEPETAFLRGVTSNGVTISLDCALESLGELRCIYCLEPTVSLSLGQSKM